MKTFAGIAIFAMFLTIVALGQYLLRNHHQMEREPLRAVSYTLIAVSLVFLVTIFLLEAL